MNVREESEGLNKSSEYLSKSNSKSMRQSKNSNQNFMS